MRIVFDHGVPHALRHQLTGHEVNTADYLGWETLNNGDLLNAAEDQRFDVLITTDQALVDQQRITGRTIRVLVPAPANWPIPGRHIPEIQEALDQTSPGTVAQIRFTSDS